MKKWILRTFAAISFLLIGYVPNALACSVCKSEQTSFVYNGTTYYYQTGGCANPNNNSYGHADCYSTYQSFTGPPSFQALVACAEGGYECYYIEVTGGGGGGAGGGDEGGGPRDQDGYCPPWYAYCY